MKRRLVLDANVLVPYDLTCLFLALAEQGVVDLRWSDRILDEVARTLLHKLQLPESNVISRVRAMRRGFPEAAVTEYEHRMSELSCDEKDRHVAAAAIEAGAAFLVTVNLRDFDAEELEEQGVELIHPDQMLLRLLAEKPRAVRQAISKELAGRTNTLDTADQFLRALTKFIPETAKALQADASNLDLLAGWFRAPSSTITREEAAEAVLAYLKGRAEAGVMLAAGFTTAALTAEGELATTWDGEVTVNGPLLLELSPFENLAEFVATPLAFNNEEGQQIREHVRSVHVFGEFGVGIESTAKAYSRGTGLPLEWLEPAPRAG